MSIRGVGRVGVRIKIRGWTFLECAAGLISRVIGADWTRRFAGPVAAISRQRPRTSSGSTDTSSHRIFIWAPLKTCVHS